MTLRPFAVSAARIVRLLAGQKRFYRLARRAMLEARDDIPNSLAENGERYVQRVVLGERRDAVVFDVGANVGDWTEMALGVAAQTGANAKVHAFEPCADTFKILDKRSARWKGVTLVQKACSCEPGVARLRLVAPGAGTNSLVDRGIDGDYEEVALTTVDEYCAEKNILHIDLLKIDAEGHDREVLLGARGMLADRRIEVVQFEYNQTWIASRSFLRDAFQLLIPMGYRVGKLVGDEVQVYPAWHWELETFREANYVAWLEPWTAKLRTIPAAWVPESDKCGF